MPLNLITIIIQTNEIKLNGYTLPERVKTRMVLKLRGTQQKELGFALCSRPDNIIVEGQDIEGTSDRIIIDPSMCKNGKNFWDCIILTLVTTLVQVLLIWVVVGKVRSYV